MELYVKTLQKTKTDRSLFAGQGFQPEGGLCYRSINFVQIQVQTCDECWEWGIVITALCLC